MIQTKTLLVAIFTFLSLYFTAQSQRFAYEYVFVKDSTKMNDKESELMYLDVSKKGSKFFSQKREIADSLHLEIVKNQNKDFSGIDYGLVVYVVEKSYPDFKINLFDNLDMSKYKISDNRKMDWKILSEKETIGDLNAQKATCNFAGRTWTAWFVSDIPIQDGPYKFNGLPGLIIKIEDKTKSHSFVLKEIKKLRSDQEWKSDGEKKSFNAIIAIDQEKYKKQFKDNRENPTKGMRQMMSGGNKIMMIDEKGKPLDIEEMMRDMEKNAKANNDKNNNVLELELLQ